MPIRFAAVCLALLLALPAGAAPAATDARIESVGLFKNGLAVVRRRLVVRGADPVDLADLPRPIHGTFWIESDAPIGAHMTTRTVLHDADLRPTGVIATDLAGGRVSVTFADENLPVTEGRVVAQRGGASPMLVLDTETGRVYLDASGIAYLRVLDAPPAPAPTPTQLPVLRLRSLEPRTAPTEVTITYLTRGLSWAPSYRLDMADASVLRVTQKAVVANELIDLDDVEIELISGFPNIEFAHVTSPMAPNVGLDQFFQSLAQRPGWSSGSHMVMQQAIMSNYSAPNDGGGGPILPTGDGVDMHEHSIGRHTLARGASLMLTTATDTTPYERIIDWRIPDLRDEWGNVRRQPDPQEDAPWDAVRFVNPFDFPMTTAPALITDGRRISGQRQSTWVNPGERTTVRVTKSLSVRTSAVEHEEEGEREIIRIGGRNFRRPVVAGELLVCNHRAVPETVVIRRELSGELLNADDNPESGLLESGVYSVNPRREIVWTLELAPGETRTLHYRYSVLAHH